MKQNNRRVYHFSHSKLLAFTSTLFLSAALLPQQSYAGIPKCFAVNDNGVAELWFTVPNTTASPVPSVTTITMDRGFNAEGSAYRPSDQKMYLFECDGDNVAPCSLYAATIDYDTATATTALVQSDIVPSGAIGAVEGAVFETQPNGTEFLYATIGEDEGGSSQGQIYKWDTSTWTLQSGYPLNLSGDATFLTGLAFDARNNIYYGSIDNPSGDGTSNNPDYYTVNLSTGATTFAGQMDLPIDGEGLSFAADGKFYTEEDQGSSGTGRVIYAIDPATGALTSAATFSGTSGDAESLACNAGGRSDFGDAPGSYGYAVHSIPVFNTTPSPLHLGLLRPDDDDDPLAQASAGADGDDSNGTAPNPIGSVDEDGVNQGGVSLQNQSLQLGGTYTLTVATNGEIGGYLNAWFDLNADGDFDDAGEQIATNLVGASGGTISIPVVIPAGSPAAQTYARFRYSTEQSLPSADLIFSGQDAVDGEVEDYRVVLAGDPIGITKISDDAGNADGNVRPGDVITYTINPAFTGSGALSNLTVSDTIPANTSYLADSDTPEALADADPLVWNFGSTAPAESVSVSAVAGGITTFIAAKDTYISEEKNDENFGDKDELLVEVDSGDPKEIRTLVQWDLTTLPPGATVLSASMEFWANEDKDVVVDVRRITSNWTEGDGTNGQDADWDNALTSTPWTTSGGDYDSTIIGSFTQNNKDEWDTISDTGGNVTSLTQDWLDGTFSNFGVIVISDGTVDKEAAKFTSKEKAANLAPRLLITLQGTAGTSASLSAASPLVNDGDTITVTLTLNSDISGQVSPGALTVIDQVGGANASCLTPASTNIIAGTPLLVTYTCTAAAGTSLPSSVAFRADNITSTNTSIDFIPDATNQGPKSNSVLIAPDLTFQVTVDDPLPAGVTEITNTAIVTDDYRVPGQASVTDPVVFNVSGNVFNDANGLTDSIVNGTGIGSPGGTQLYATLVDGSGNVVQSVAVNPNGSYNFPGVAGGSYTVEIGTVQGNVGNSAPGPSVPSGWLNTGDNIGTGSGDDTTPNGTQAITVGTTHLTQVNFGIEQPPNSGENTQPDQNNPGGTTSVTVPATAFSGTDPNPGTVTSIRITAFPSNATSITINGTNYTSGTWPAGGVTVPTDGSGEPTQTIEVDPVDGDTTVNIPYAAIDNAGVEDTTPGYVELPFAVTTVSGSVWYDQNVDGIQDGVISGVTISMYADSDGNGLLSTAEITAGPVGTTVTDGNGDYSFVGQPPGSYIIAETQPGGFASTAESTGSNASDTNDVTNSASLDNLIPVTLAVGESDIDNVFWETDNSTEAVNDDNNTLVRIPVSGDVTTNDFDPEQDTQTVTSIGGGDDDYLVDSTGDGVPDSPAGFGVPVVVAGVDASGNPVSNAGALVFNNDGSYTFTPNGDLDVNPLTDDPFVGTITVEYQTCDNGTPVVCDTALLTIIVSPLPDPVDPSTNIVIANDDDNVSYGNPVSDNVLVNDSDPQDDAFTVTGLTFDTDGDGVADDPVAVGTSTTVYGTDNDGNTVVAGTLVINASGEYTYTPCTDGSTPVAACDGAFTGTVSVNYEITDANSTPATDSAVLTIHVLGEPDKLLPPTGSEVNDPPFAGDDLSSTPMDTPVTDNWLSNDDDPNDGPGVETTEDADDEITIQFIDKDDIQKTSNPIDPDQTVGGGTSIGVATTKKGGDIEFFDDGTYIYTPPAGYVGPDQFVYEICDVTTVLPNPLCASATIYLLVTPVMDFGDAPSSYTTQGGVAPRHYVTPKLFLGTVPDNEFDGFSIAAGGDNNGTNGDGADEDGVGFSYSADKITATVTVTNNTDSIARVCGYLDGGVAEGGTVDINDTFDRGATVGSLEERCFDVAANSGSTMQTVSWFFPVTALSTTYARFRVSTGANFLSNNSPSPTGVLPDGEVEDYQLTVNPTSVTIGYFGAQMVSVDEFLSLFSDNNGLLNLLAQFDAELAASLSDADAGTIMEALYNILDPDGDGLLALVRWETLEERGTIGFFVERREHDGAWLRVNNDMLPGLITAPLGGEYLLADPAARSGVRYQYLLIEQEARGTTRSYGPYSLEMAQ